ncbi:MAG: hypothetical protein KAW93_10845 [Methanogenium sp.]|nr:hypothetical protein [Methanogenium sp.]
MNRDRAREAIRHILESASFDVDDNEQIDLSATRGDEGIVVLCSNDEREIEAYNKRRYIIQLDFGPEECTKLLFTTNMSVNSGNCICWREQELEKYAGEATVADVLDYKLELNLTQTSQSRSTRAEPEPEVLPGPKIPHFPITVTEEEAKKIAGIKGTIKCRFLPYWVYEYRSTGEKVINKYVINFESDEKGAINAINGIKTEIGTSIYDTDHVPPDSDVISPKTDGKEVKEKLISEIITRLTKTVRTSQTEGDTISYETKVVKPERKDINFDMNLVYVPIWQIRGNHIVEVNAVTGELLSEPIDDDAEII